MSKAPVCHVPPEDANIPQPGVKTFPTIPVATDLTSALMAVNALRRAVQLLTNQIDNRSTTNNFNTKPDPNQKPQWNEVERVVEKEKIYQNNDPSTGNFVEVERINRLVMQDKNSKQTWTWDRERK